MQGCTSDTSWREEVEEATTRPRVEICLTHDEDVDQQLIKEGEELLEHLRHRPDSEKNRLQIAYWDDVVYAARERRMNSLLQQKGIKPLQSL